MYLPPGLLEEKAEKIATWIVKDLDRISWVDLYSGFLAGYIFTRLLFG